MAGGATTTGGSKAGDVVAQPLASISSGNRISACALQGLVGFISGFLHLFGASLFFGAGGRHGFAGHALHVDDLLQVLGACIGVVALLGCQPPGLGAGCQQGDTQGCGECAGNHSHPRYFGERTTSTSLTW